MKRVLFPIPLVAMIAVVLVAPGVALADQTFHTVRAPFYSLNEFTYPLKDGFVVAIHMNGPVNFEKKEFQLHGAKPDTQFFIYRIFTQAIGPIPAGMPLYSGFSILTDKHGNGHIITPLSPTNPSLELAKSLNIEHLTITNVLYDGLLTKDGGQTDGVQAYAADPFETYFDFEWTP